MQLEKKIGYYTCTFGRPSLIRRRNRRRNSRGNTRVIEAAEAHVEVWLSAYIVSG